MERKLEQHRLDRDRVAVRGRGRRDGLVQDRPPTRVCSASETVDGGGRQAIHVRRGRYFDALRQVWDETSTSPEETLVAGDIFELDLAMPAALGAQVHLVTRASTMPHEIELARGRARGDAGSPLATVLERLRR